MHSSICECQAAQAAVFCLPAMSWLPKAAYAWLCWLISVCLEDSSLAGALLLPLPHQAKVCCRSRRSRQSKNSDLQMIEGSEGSEQQKGMMGRARQLWSVVGKVRTAHAATCFVKKL